MTPAIRGIGGMHGGVPEQRSSSAPVVAAGEA